MNHNKMIHCLYLQKLSLSDFEQLSRAQLLQLTAEQREGLSAELQDGVTCLLEECEEEDDDDDDGGDNGVITGEFRRPCFIATGLEFYSAKNS